MTNIVGAGARLWIAGLLLSVATCVPAETLRGKVIRILDGYTIAGLDATKREHRIRLAGIDSPERKQANYETARQHLAKLAFGKAVTVDWHKRDRYGRLVGKVEADHRDVG